MKKARVLAVVLAPALIACEKPSSSTALDPSGSSPSSDGDARSSSGGSASINCSGAQSDGAAQTLAIVDAAHAFLATFSSSSQVQYPFTRPAASSAYVGAGNHLGEQYGSALWSNYPVRDIPRPGVQRSDRQHHADARRLASWRSSWGHTPLCEPLPIDEFALPREPV